jgi:hypothetical protein
MVLILGSMGNMGKRYRAILKMLRIEHFTFDKADGQALEPRRSQLIAKALKIIVATPTHDHVRTLELIDAVATNKPRVLCEKPITKKLEEFEQLRSFRNLELFCVNQYAHLPEYETFRSSQGRTYYNYFRHGDDGLGWDCFQLFNLANGSIAINESSPIWKCRINGVQINPTNMDWAYVRMIQDFLGPMNRVWDLFIAEVISKKVVRWMAEEQIPE